MNISQTTKSKNQSLSSQKNQQERAEWHQLVVKVINWKQGPSGNGTFTFDKKITAKEWKAYKAKSIEINALGSRQKVEDNLAEIEQQIAKNNGFEE